MISVAHKLKDACRHHNIYIYGAGTYGRTLYAFLKEQNIGHIEKFIVSRADQQSVVLGKEVIALEKYVVQRAVARVPDKEDIIIVAVSELYSAEVVWELENKKLYHYITLTEKEWDVIKDETLFSCIVPQKNIAVLMYHRIIDSNYNFWKLNVSPRTFEEHIRYISQNYKVLRLEEEWSNIVEADQKYVVVTFDDGYADNYRYALPILEKYHVPATIFVSTDLIDTDEMYWWDELEKIFLIDKYRGEFVFGGVSYKISDANDSRDVCVRIRNLIKDMDPAERRGNLADLRSLLGLEQPETSELRCVNTPELERMARSPYVTIGGHTKSHLSMGSFHSENLLRLEIEESLGILEEKTGKKIKVFAYPYGGPKDRCDLADKMIADCGIKKSMLVRNGNISVDDGTYNLPRHMVFEGEDMEKKIRKIWGLYG